MQKVMLGSILLYLELTAPTIKNQREQHIQPIGNKEIERKYGKQILIGQKVFQRSGRKLEVGQCQHQLPSEEKED
jgi:hypothetical protein